MFSQYKIFLHFHTIFLHTKEITGEQNRDVPGGAGTHVGRPPRPDAVVEPVLALAACRMARTSQDVNGKIFLQNRGDTWRGVSLRAEEDEEDGCDDDACGVCVWGEWGGGARGGGGVAEGGAVPGGRADPCAPRRTRTPAAKEGWVGGPSEHHAEDGAAEPSL